MKLAQRSAGHTWQVKCNFLKLRRSKAGRSRVSCLLALCGPSTIARFIVAVVVNAVNRMLRRAASHISKESFIAVEPSFTHPDAAAPVVRVAFLVWVCAALDHHVPDCVLGRATAQYPTIAVCGISIAGLPCCSKASATLRVARSQVIAFYNLLGSTFTMAQVLGSLSRHELNHSEASKCLAA